MDIVSKAIRSRMMASVKSKNTSPELKVRQFFHAAGLRFRIHVGDLPGKPDIVLPRYRAVVFVHGCFWHRHEGCRFAYQPKSNAQFWAHKFDGNVTRDMRHVEALRSTGWTVYTVWECEANSVGVLGALVDDIRSCLGNPLVKKL